MASLYEISNELLKLFETIEENGGECSDEEYNGLIIKEDELKDKLTNYVKAVKEFQKDADFCKQEKQRINDRQNIYKNRVERLKNVMLDAVLNFGQEAKTNKFIELPTYKLFTKNTKSIELDTVKINFIIESVMNYILECLENDVYIDQGLDIDGVVSAINANTRELDDGIKRDVTINDLLNTTVDITYTTTLAKLFNEENMRFTTFICDNPNVKITPNINKDEIKFNMLHLNENNGEITIAKEVTNTSLIIK